MVWKPASQGDLAEILYYAQDQMSLDHIAAAQRRISDITPVALSQEAINRIEGLITAFRLADSAVSGASGAGKVSDGRTLIKADVLGWSDNEKLSAYNFKKLQDQRNDLREQIRIALGVGWGNAMDGQGAGGKCNRRVRS